MSNPIVALLNKKTGKKVCPFCGDDVTGLEMLNYAGYTVWRDEKRGPKGYQAFRHRHNHPGKQWSEHQAKGWMKRRKRIRWKGLKAIERWADALDRREDEELVAEAVLESPVRPKLVVSAPDPGHAAPSSRYYDELTVKQEVIEDDDEEPVEVEGDGRWEPDGKELVVEVPWPDVLVSFDGQQAIAPTRAEVERAKEGKIRRRNPWRGWPVDGNGKLR